MGTGQEFLGIIRETGKPESLYMLFLACPQKVVQAMQCMEVKKGHTFIQAGTPCEAVYIILNGRASGTDFQVSGNVYRFREYCAGEVLGDFELFSEFPEYRVTVCAATDCELAVIPSSIYLAWMQSDIHALFMRTRSLMKTLTSEASDGRKYLFLNCKDRLIIYLAEAYEKREGNADGQWKLQKTQPELADRIGFNVRTLQRNLYSLEEMGFISLEKGKIHISQQQYGKLKQYLQKNLLI